MLSKFASYVFLIVGIVIGLGAFGHGRAVQHIHAGIDRFPIDPNVSTMLYVVWYFVSGCMLVFGSTIVWLWLRLRKGEGGLFAAFLIGVLYTAIGVGGMIYRHGDTFMAFFILLGVLLLLSSFALRRGLNPGRR